MRSMRTTHKSSYPYSPGGETMPRIKQTTATKCLRQSRNSRQLFPEGTTVRNRYSGLEYKIASITDKTVFVTDGTGGNLEMAKADLECI